MIIPLNVGAFLAFDCITFSLFFSILGGNDIPRVHKNNLPLEMSYVQKAQDFQDVFSIHLNRPCLGCAL